MHIIYCIPSLWNSGGMERVLTLKANYLVDKMGVNITIITTDQNNNEDFYALDGRINRIDLGINFYKIKQCNKASFSIQYFKKILLYWKRLSTTLKKLSGDIVVSLFGAELYFFKLINDGSKKVAEFHFTKYYWLNNKTGILYAVRYLRNACHNLILRRLDKFVVLTNEDKLLWGDMPNIVVIPNPARHLDLSFAQLQSKSAIAVGRLSEQKGFDMLIHSWRLVHRCHPDWTLSIYGSGEMKEELDKLILENKLGNVVKIHAPIKDIEKKYVESSIYVLSSRYEGLPMVLLEAMSVGLPIVAFECPCGPRDIIKDGFNGLLIKKNDVEDMARGINHLIENKEVRIEMGHNGRKCSVSYSEDNIMRLWYSLFIKLN